MTLEVIIDDRERASGLAEGLEEALGHPPEVRRLERGDVLVGGQILIERKCASDFVASLLEGRLERQLAALSELKDMRPILLLEGQFSQAILGGMAPEEVRQAILSIQLDWRFPVLRTRDLDHSIQWICSLANRVRTAPQALGSRFEPSSPRRAPAGQRPQRRKPGDPVSLQLAALGRIEGIGPERARALLERFGSIHALKSASEKDLTAVPRIGPEAARAIVRYLSKG